MDEMQLYFYALSKLLEANENFIHSIRYSRLQSFLAARGQLSETGSALGGILEFDMLIRNILQEYMNISRNLFYKMPEFDVLTEGDLQRYQDDKDFRESALDALNMQLELVTGISAQYAMRMHKWYEQSIISVTELLKELKLKLKYDFSIQNEGHFVLDQPYRLTARMLKMHDLLEDYKLNENPFRYISERYSFIDLDPEVIPSLALQSLTFRTENYLASSQEWMCVDSIMRAHLVTINDEIKKIIELEERSVDQTVLVHPVQCHLLLTTSEYTRSESDDSRNGINSLAKQALLEASITQRPITPRRDQAANKNSDMSDMSDMPEQLEIAEQAQVRKRAS